MDEPREQADGLRERCHAGVRDGDAAADPGRAEALPLEQPIEQLALVKVEDTRGAARQLGH
jgi:hypothetical protein